VALTVGGNNANTTFSGSLSDSNSGGSLTKVGTGTLVLSGTNAYGGGTIVLSGILELLNSSAILDGSNLMVGGDASTFMAPVVPAAPTAADAQTVPEPGTVALLSVVVCCAAVYHRLRLRRRKQ